MPLAELLCLSMLTLNIGGSYEKAAFACQQADIIVKQSKKYKIKPEIIVAIIHHESRFNNKLIGRSKECGLMQIIPRYTGNKKTGVRKLSCYDLFNTKINIKAGIQYFNYWLRKYAKGNYKIALCAYNKGYRCKGKNSNKKGISYAKKILRTARKIKRTMREIKDDGC